MHAHYGVPVVDGHLVQHVVADDAGVVHQDGGCAELRGDPVDSRSHLGLIGHVRADGDGGSAGSADLVDHRLAGSGVQVKDSHRHPVGRELLRDCRSDTACPTRDDRRARHVCLLYPVHLEFIRPLTTPVQWAQGHRVGRR